MASSSWDEMKRIREDEYFHKQEQEQLKKLKEKAINPEANVDRGLEVIRAFTTGKSPLSGGSLYQATVAGVPIIDCPEEQVVTLSYQTLKNLIEKSQQNEDTHIGAWNIFLNGQNS